MPRNAATNRFRIRNQNASIFINGTDGAAGNALSIANNASLSPTAAVTLEIRFRPTARKAAILFDNSTLGVTNSYYLSISADGGLLWYSTIGGVAKNIIGTTTKVKFNEWNMVNATYDGAAIKLFLNGSQLAETLAATGSMGTNSGPLRIGAYYSGGTSQTFQGSISQPRVYAAGCTLAEHQDRYYRSITSAALQAALVLDLNTEIGAGSTVTDLSGLGNNATMGASASWTSDSPFKSRKASVNANMVRNGDFEYAPPFTAATTAAARFIDGTSGGSTTNDLFSWATVSGAVTASAAASFDTTVSFSGSNSIKLSTLNTSGAIVVANTTATGAPTTTVGLYRLSPNTSYTLTAKCKTSNVASNGAFVFIREYTSALAIVATNNTAKLSGTNDWTTLSVTITTGATTQYAAVALCNNVAGNVSDAWFDDITLTPVYPEGRVPANGNLVKNFDFEVVPTLVAPITTAARWIDGSAAGSATNSTYKYAVPSGSFGGGGSANFDSTVSRSGSSSLKLSTNAVGGSVSVTQYVTLSEGIALGTIYRLLPSTSYTLTGWIKTTNAAAGSVTLSCRELNAATSTVVTNTSSSVDGTADWTQVTVTFTTAASTVYGALIFRNNVTGNVSDAWFDDIYLAPTTNPGRVIIT